MPVRSVELGEYIVADLLIGHRKHTFKGTRIIDSYNGPTR